MVMLPVLFAIVADVIDVIAAVAASVVVVAAVVCDVIASVDAGVADVTAVDAASLMFLLMMHLMCCGCQLLMQIVSQLMMLM